MSTRAKFVCSSVEDYGQSKKIALRVVYEGELGKDEEKQTVHQGYTERRVLAHDRQSGRQHPIQAGPRVLCGLPRGTRWFLQRVGLRVTVRGLQ